MVLHIYLYEKGFLHAKTIVVDNEMSSVGTTNIDPRSFSLNFEVNAVVYDQPIAKKLQNLFLEDVQCSSKLTFERYKERSLLIKFKDYLLTVTNFIIQIIDTMKQT